MNMMHLFIVCHPFFFLFVSPFVGFFKFVYLFKSCSWQEIYDTDDDNFLLHDIRHEGRKQREITSLKIVSRKKILQFFELLCALGFKESKKY